MKLTNNGVLNWKGIIIWTVVWIAIALLATLWATSPEQWYDHQTWWHIK